MSGIARNVLLVLVGRGGFLALSLIAQVLIFHFLGNDDAGRFAMCMVLVRVLADCLAEPLDMSIMRDVPAALATNRAEAYRLVRGAFLVRITAAAIVVLIVAALSSWIAAYFFHSSSDADLVIVSAFGAAGVLLCRANLTYFQSEEKFTRVIATEAVMHTGRFAAIVALGLSGLLTSRTGIFCYVLMTYLSFVVGLFLLPREIKRVSLQQCSDPRSVLHYVKWMVAVTVLAAVYERINEFLIARFHGPGELALYSAALTLAILPEFLTGCLSSVYQPRAIVAFRGGQFRALQWSYIKLAMPLGAIGLFVALTFSGPAFLAILGERYAAAIPAFRLLVTATLVWLVFSPLPAILMILLAPRQNLLLNIVMFIVTFAAGCWVVPTYGATGGAALFLVVRMGNLAALWIIAEQLLRNQRIVADETTAVGDSIANDHSVDVAGASP